MWPRPATLEHFLIELTKRLDALERQVAELRRTQRDRAESKQSLSGPRRKGSDLHALVAVELAKDPLASANRIAVAVPARRQDVLRIIREARAVGGQFPLAGNRGSDEDA